MTRGGGWKIEAGGREGKKTKKDLMLSQALASRCEIQSKAAKPKISTVVTEKKNWISPRQCSATAVNRKEREDEGEAEGRR